MAVFAIPKQSEPTESESDAGKELAAGFVKVIFEEGVKEVGMPSFAWQVGDAAVTVSVTSREAIQKYIANQEEHHRRRSFRKKLVEVLQKVNEFDARYLHRRFGPYVGVSTSSHSASWKHVSQLSA
jgi:hypothetical protein